MRSRGRIYSGNRRVSLSGAGSSQRMLERHRTPRAVENWAGAKTKLERVGPNPSIERTVTSGLRPLVTAAHVKR